MKMHATFRVDSHHTDMNGIATATAIMQYIQETANLQHVHYGPTMEELRAGGKAFILSRVAFDVMAPLYAQDQIEAISWLCEAKGFGYFRNTVLERNGETVAAMNAFWGVINIETRRPLRVEEVTLGFTTENEPLPIQAPTRFRLPKEMPTLGSRTVTYSDCDENGHVNNTRYPGILCDFLPTMWGKRVTACSLNYMNEAVLGSSFTVTGETAEDGAHLFRTLLEDGRVGCEARILLG